MDFFFYCRKISQYFYCIFDQINAACETRAVAITAISQYRAFDEHNHRGMQQPQYLRVFFFRKVMPFLFYTSGMCTEY